MGGEPRAGTIRYTCAMKKTRPQVPPLTPIFLTVLLTAGAPAQLPPGLERIREAETVRLAALYALPPELARAPMDVRFFQGPAGETPPGWSGLPPFAAGAAQPSSGRLVVHGGRTGRYPFGDDAQTLRHELSHVLLHRSLGYQPPRWLDEGLAMRAGSEWGAADSGFLGLALFRAARGTLTLEELERDFVGGEVGTRRSYAVARGFVRDLFPTDREVTAFVLDARQTGSPEATFLRRFGVTPQSAFRVWARDLPWWGEWLVFLGSPGLLWGVVVLLFLAAVVASIRRKRKLYEQLPD